MKHVARIAFVLLACLAFIPESRAQDTKPFQTSIYATWTWDKTILAQLHTVITSAGTPEGDMIRSDIFTTYTAPSSPPTAIQIGQATAQGGGKIALTYVPGGGHDAISRRLEWQVVGVDPGYARDVALNIVGQTLTGFAPGKTMNLRVKTANPAGNTYSTVKSVTTL